MKKISEIEEEFKTYKAKSESVTNLNEFMTYLIVGVDDAEENIKECKKEIKANKRMYIPACIRNLFPLIYEEEDVEFYLDDNELIVRMIRATLTQKDYYEKIMGIVDENNFLELLRLADFSTDYYNEFINYIDMKRTSLESLYKGIRVVNNRTSDNSEVFDEFFIKKLEEITSTKTVEKQMKMC